MAFAEKNLALQSWLSHRGCTIPAFTNGTGIIKKLDFWGVSQNLSQVQQSFLLWYIYIASRSRVEELFMVTVNWLFFLVVPEKVCIVLCNSNCYQVCNLRLDRSSSINCTKPFMGGFKYHPRADIALPDQEYYMESAAPFLSLPHLFW